MKVNKTVKRPDPILVDAALLDSFAHIFAEAHGFIRQNFADNAGMSLQQLDEALAGHRPPGTEQYKIDILSDRLSEVTKVNYSLSYSNGLRVDTTDLEQIKQALRDEASHPDQIRINTGDYLGLRISIEIGGYTSWASEYSVIGNRRDVDYLGSRIERSILAAGPSNPWLHGKYPGMILWILSFISIFLCTLVLMALALPLIDDEYKSSLLIPAVIVWISSAFISEWVKDTFRKVFPSCEFAFGLPRRKREAQRSLIFIVLTVILIPILITVAGMMIQPDADDAGEAMPKEK